jgi:SAM-dependent methyltransferase
MKRLAPAAERNKEPILEVLRELLPTADPSSSEPVSPPQAATAQEPVVARPRPVLRVLELASGTGQHAAFFAAALPWVRWLPTDPDPDAIVSIAHYRFDAGLPNLEAPFLLDAQSDDWSIDAVDAVVCINMIHIAPWTACLGLMAGASRVLPLGGPLMLYGPFRIDGEFTAASNAEFDQSLRERDPRWGVRELRDVARAANDAGLQLDRIVPRPANNHVVIFRKSSDLRPPTTPSEFPPETSAGPGAPTRRMQ